MITLSYKVLLNNNSYGAAASALSWPSTGSTSSMVIIIASVLELPAFKQLVLNLILAGVASLAIVCAVFLMPAFKSLASRITYIGTTTLLSWATLLSTFEILSIWYKSILTFTIVVYQTMASLAFALTIFHIIGYTKTNTTITLWKVKHLSR